MRGFLHRSARGQRESSSGRLTTIYIGPWMLFFLEDESQATGYAAESLAVFRRMTHNLIKADIGGTRGIAKSRRQAAWNNDYAVRVLSRIFEGNV